MYRGCRLNLLSVATEPFKFIVRVLISALCSSGIEALMDGIGSD